MEEAELYPLVDEVLPEPQTAAGLEATQSRVTPENDDAKTAPENISTELEVDEAELAKQGVDHQPQTILAHIEGKAGRDELKEKDYELSHEIKDEKGSQPMVPIGTVVGDIPKRQPALAGLQPPVNPPPVLPAADDRPLSLAKPTSLPYKQAMQRGFAAGLAAAVIFALIYLA